MCFDPCFLLLFSCCRLSSPGYFVNPGKKESFFLLGDQNQRTRVSFSLFQYRSYRENMRRRRENLGKNGFLKIFLFMFCFTFSFPSFSLSRWQWNDDGLVSHLLFRVQKVMHFSIFWGDIVCCSH